MTTEQRLGKQEKEKEKKKAQKNTFDPTHVHIALESLSSCTLAVVLRLHRSS